jgi:CheY-like chemotaxis protein
MARILCIDDEWIILRALSRLLSDEHQVITTLDARLALGMLDGGNAFDVILCDLHMPEMSGDDFLGALERDHVAAASRLVFMTAGPTTADATRLLAAMEGRCLTKPFTAACLRATVAAVLGSSA